jgi:hypothetical protein
MRFCNYYTFVGQEPDTYGRTTEPKRERRLTDCEFAEFEKQTYRSHTRLVSSIVVSTCDKAPITSAASEHDNTLPVSAFKSVSINLREGS